MTVSSLQQRWSRVLAPFVVTVLGISVSGCGPDWDSLLALARGDAGTADAGALGQRVAQQKVARQSDATTPSDAGLDAGVLDGAASNPPAEAR